MGKLKSYEFHAEAYYTKVTVCSTNLKPFVWNVGSEINMLKWDCHRLLESFKILVNWNMALTTHIPWHRE